MIFYGQGEPDGLPQQLLCGGIQSRSSLIHLLISLSQIQHMLVFVVGLHLVQGGQR